MRISLQALKALKEDYIYIGQYKTPLLYYGLFLNWVEKSEYGRKLGINGTIMTLDGHLFMHKSDWDKISRITLNAVESENYSIFKDIFAMGDESIRKVMRWSSMLKNDTTLNVDFIRNLFDAVHALEFPWFFSLPMGDAVTSVVERKLLRYSLPKEYLQYFFSFNRKTLMMKHYDELSSIYLDMVKKGIISKSLESIKENDKKFYSRIQSHIKRYYWLGAMHFWGHIYDEHAFLSQIKMLAGKEDIIEGRIALKKRMIPKGLRQLLQYSRQLSYYRQMFAESCAISSGAWLSRLHEIAMLSGIPPDLVSWMSPNELLSNGSNNKPNVDELIQRKKAYGLIPSGDDWLILTDKDLSIVITYLLGKPKIRKELKGISASPGNASGRARVITSPSDLPMFKSGDIMVVPETTPDFVPYMLKASAILADMGGISSHAAIVSRELKIPCIVSLKDVTRIIKDGDFVEVDAKEGIVKIIKKKEAKK